MKGEKYESTFWDTPSHILHCHDSGNWICPYLCSSWTLLSWSRKKCFTVSYPLFFHILNWNKKWRVQEREWVDEGHVVKWQQECWEKNENERNWNKSAFQHHALSQLSDVSIDSNLWTPRVWKIMCLNVVISEQYYLHQTCIYVFSSWVLAF